MKLAANLRAVVLLCPLLFLAACRQEVPAKPEVPRPVRSVLAESSQVGAVLTLPGEIRPRVETRYGFRVGGKISQRLVSIGDRVKPGAVLARLDPQDIAPAIAAQTAQVQAATTELTLAGAELARQKELRTRNYISEAQLERYQAAFDGAGSRLKAAQAQLDSARNAALFQELKVDVSGVVTAIEAEAGQVVAAGQPVIRVANSGEKEVLVNLPEAQVAMVKSVRMWQVTISALADHRVDAQLRELSPVADPASRTYPMRLSLTGDTHGVELGMTAVVSALQQRNSAFILPVSVLWSQDGKPRVWIVDPKTSRVRGVTVKTGGLSDDSVHIVEGLQTGDRVVTAGASLLSEGQQVRLLEGAR